MKIQSFLQFLSTYAIKFRVLLATFYTMREQKLITYFNFSQKLFKILEKKLQIFILIPSFLFTWCANIIIIIIKKKTSYTNKQTTFFWRCIWLFMCLKIVFIKIVFNSEQGTDKNLIYLFIYFYMDLIQLLFSSRETIPLSFQSDVTRI